MSTWPNLAHAPDGRMSFSSQFKHFWRGDSYVQHWTTCNN
jgi:hypothetical protein